MNFTYWIITNTNSFGYEILRNNKLIIRQVKLPNTQTDILTEQTAIQLAKLSIEKLKRNVSAIITQSEEQELSSNQVTDERIVELAEIYTKG